MRELVFALIDAYQRSAVETPAIADGSESVEDILNLPPTLLFTGIRGSGKSARLQSILLKARALGVPRQRTLYLDLADKRLLRADPAEVLPCIVDAFLERFPRARRDTMYFAFDNISHVEGWASFVSRLQDTYEVRIIAADACKSWIDGRSPLPRGAIVEEMHPASSAELSQTRWDHEILRATRSEGSAEEDGLRRYLELGGLTCASIDEDPHAHSALQRHLDAAIMGDVLRKAPHTNSALCEALCVRALDATASRLSVTKTSAEFKERGLATTRSTLSNILAQLEDAHLIHIVKDFNRAMSANARLPWTVFAGDHGLAQAFARKGSLDARRLASTVVYLNLRRREHLGEIFLYRTEKGEEAGFVCGNPRTSSAFSLTALCIDDRDPSQLARANARLRKALEETGLRKATLVTSSTEAKESAGTGKYINCIPLRSWLSDDRII